MYTSAQLASGIMRFFGTLSIVVGTLLIIASLLGMGSLVGRPPEMLSFMVLGLGGAYGAIFGVAILLQGALLLSIGEIVRLLIDIAYNTEETNESLRRLKPKSTI